MESHYAVDYGDLPNTYSSVLGANHIATGLTLGKQLDTETSAFASTDADGDDGNTGDDEDGLTSISYQEIIPTFFRYVTQINRQGCTGCWLNGWIDLNNNGSFMDAGEHFISNTNFANFWK